MLDWLIYVLGHRVYDMIWVDNESKQLFCTCGGRVIADAFMSDSYYTVVESTCPAIELFANIIGGLRSDFPAARVVR